VADEPKSYGSPMGTEPPGNTTRARPKAGPAPTEEVRRELANRYAGESRRQTEAPPGGRRLKADTSDLSAAGAAQKIRNKKYSDLKKIDEMS
jgi:hypothetical protein